LETLYDEFIRKIDEKSCAKYIDHTLLKPQLTIDDVRKAIDHYKKYGFATLVLSPYYINVTNKLDITDVRLCSVVGFPLGFVSTSVKVFEAKELLEKGVCEIDMVMNISAFKSRDYSYVVNDIKSVVDVAKSYNAIVKVIIETGLLTDEEKVKAVELIINAGADYVKTSTGFIAGGATVHDVRLLKEASQGRIKVKAAGGIRHAYDAIAMILAGADRIGTSTGVQIIEEYYLLRRNVIKE